CEGNDSRVARPSPPRITARCEADHAATAVGLFSLRAEPLADRAPADTRSLLPHRGGPADCGRQLFARDRRDCTRILLCREPSHAGSRYAPHDRGSRRRARLWAVFHGQPAAGAIAELAYLPVESEAAGA